MLARSTKLRGPFLVLLGAPYVDNDGETCDFLPERRFELLGYLAFRGGWVSRDELAFMFWPDQDNAGARRNLRWLLHSVRDFPEFAPIEAERDRVRLTLPTDVHQFETAVREEKWKDAVALYRGALCPGLEARSGEPFAQWLRLERGRLAEMFRRATLALIATSNPAEVVPLAHQLIAADPADEEALRAALRALLRVEAGS